MNWPQWRIDAGAWPALSEEITVGNFREKLGQKQVFYDGGSCGSAIEFDSIGEPVDGKIAAKLVSDLRMIKEEAAALHDKSDQEKKRNFDSKASERLHQANIPDHQGWNAAVWVFLQSSLFDVVHWRWAKSVENLGCADKNISYKDRLFSQPVNRGCLSRLWLWNKILIDPDRPQGEDERHLINNLGEDNKVAIIERTTASSDGRLALAIARKYVGLPGSLAIPNSQVLRRVMKLVILRMAGFETMSLDKQQLGEFVNKCFTEAQDENRWKTT